MEAGAPRIWIHLNRIRKKQMEEKIGTGHSLHDVVSLLRVIPSIWANLEPYSKKVNGKKTGRTAPNRLPSFVGAELIFR